MTVWDDDLTDAVANGIDVRTGRYAVPPLKPGILAAVAEGRPLSAAELDAVRDQLHRRKDHLGVADHIDVNDLSKTGWGVVFAENDPKVDAAREALAPLLARRRDEAGSFYHEYVNSDGVAVGESGNDFMARHGTPPGAIDPEQTLPYYLLLVGSPQQITFDTQADMGARLAVGRLTADSIDELAAYAEQTVKREREGRPSSKRAAVWATRNSSDVSTQRSARFLATPLADAFEKRSSTWTVDRYIGDNATKDALRELIHDGAPPSILFTASHGIRFPFEVDDADTTAREAAVRAQLVNQGALITQDWPGPMEAPRELIVADELFAASDVGDSANLNGMIAFLFACFSAGTPATDEFLPPEAAARTIAPAPFVANLPQRLLTKGAAAVFGHVERAWTWSFRWPNAGASTTTFQSVLNAIATGKRVGAAADHLGVRYTQVTAELATQLRKRAANFANDDIVAGLWTAQTDARNFIVLGDPAVRLTPA
jgi:hypothetical protein